MWTYMDKSDFSALYATIYVHYTKQYKEVEDTKSY